VSTATLPINIILHDNFGHVTDQAAGLLSMLPGQTARQFFAPMHGSCSSSVGPGAPIEDQT